MERRPLDRILYVEDEPDIRTVGKLALETVGGFTIEACGSGQEALDKIGGFLPELVLLDVMMPNMDGPTTLQNLRGMPEFANVPVVFLTAQTQAHEVTKLRTLGALEVLNKPFDPMTLADDIRRIWEERNVESR